MRDLQIAGVVLEARGDRIHVDAPVGLITPEIRASLIRHKPELLAMLLAADPAEYQNWAPVEDAPVAWIDRSDVIIAIEYLAGWWPLSVTALCGALAAQTKPLAAVGCRAFVAHLDAITPADEAKVRLVAQELVAANVIPARSVDLRERAGR